MEFFHKNRDGFSHAAACFARSVQSVGGSVPEKLAYRSGHQSALRDGLVTLEDGVFTLTEKGDEVATMRYKQSQKNRREKDA